MLKDMVLERDKKIAQLEAAVQEHDKKLAECRQELQKVQDESSQSKLQYRRTIASLVKKRDEGLHKIQKIEKEVRNQNGSLHVYADILKEAAPESVDSSYVVRMQSQLCKAMHSMGILEHQLAIVNAISTDVVKSQKEAITTVVDEKTKVELEVMNELVAIDDEKRKVEETWKERLEKEQVAVVQLRNELGIDDKSKDSDDEASSSESEDEYDAELREGLEELNEAIAEMEEETEKQLDEIESLRAQLEKLQTSGDDSQENGHQDEGEAAPSATEEREKEDSLPEENGDSPTDNESDEDAEANGDKTHQ